MMAFQTGIRTRLALGFALALAVGMSLFACGIWFAMQASLLADLNATLVDRAQTVAKFVDRELSYEPMVRMHQELDEFSGGLPPGIWIEVHDASHTLMFASRFRPNKRFRTHTETAVIKGSVYEIRVTGDLEAIDHTLFRLRLLLIGSIPAVILIAAFGGIWLSRRALAPVDAITEAARGISIENLSHRLAVPRTGDELQRLAETWNGMLERMEAAVDRLSQFTADASHELRTPLAVIRATAELAARRARSPEAYRASLNEVVAETDRMTQLVEDLLFLARCDAGGSEMPHAFLDLMVIVKEACAAVGPLAERKSVRLSLILEETPVSGNAAELRRLMFVLLDNAIKFSRPDTIIEVSLAEWKLSVRDRGIGISEQHLPHIFERFYQADASRSATGYGLGLAQAQSIARQHGATLQVHSKPGQGSTFGVAFKPVRAGAIPELLLLR